jgi:hypothetical protein
MQISSLPTNSSLQNNPRYQFSLKSETIDNLTILLAAILKLVASYKWPWMQISSLPINSSLQNNIDINFYWNRRPLTIWRFCWQPFWKWWPRKNDPECKFHHYQPIPHFKIILDINFHWNRRPLTIWRFVGSHFEIGGLVKMTLNANFIIINQFLTSK